MLTSNSRNRRSGVFGLTTDVKYVPDAVRGSSDLPVSFLKPKSKLGAMVNLSGKSATGGPITVRLEPCGMGKGWLVDPAGKPVEGYRESSLIVMFVTPGADALSRKTASEG
jgi:hypothetical protein